MTTAERPAPADAGSPAGQTAAGPTEGEAVEPAVAANYAYWQRHGGEWADEYDQRKKWSVKYHITELMLSEYVRQHAPLRVLEFGCGVGRHLKHLRQLPEVGVFGYDQSPTMVAQCLRWADPAWLAEHVRVGPPTGRLPYGDGEFDLVYSSEVLVHVRPEDLDGILTELLRICRGQLLHFEPAPQTAICSGAHDGCWNHDLVAAYARLGRECEMLTPGYVEHAPYRVVLGGAPRYTWPPALLALLQRMEGDLGPTLQAGRDTPALRERVVRLESELQTAREQIRAAHHEYAVLFGKLEAVERELRIAREAARDAESRAAELAARVATAEAERTALDAQLAAADAQRSAAESRRDELQGQLAQATAAANRLTRERDAFLRRAHDLLGI